MTSARVDGAAVTFRVPDPGYRLAGVRLSQQVRIPGDRLDFRRAGPDWELVIARPPVWRMEYLFELRYPDGGGQTVTDPGNPRQAPGAFGPKSVLEFPSYVPPGWLTAPAAPGRGATFEVPGGSLDEPVQVRTWAPADAPDDEVLPLLVVHDGPEYDALASLTGYLAAGVAGGWLPRLRAALAILHAYCRYPDTFDGLFLQSGSFFCPRLDAHERRFRYYPRVVRFVAGVLEDTAARRPGLPGLPGRRVPVAATCGAIEENLGNNRLVDQALRARGYQAELHEVPDVHNYTAWRDAFDPHLTRLLGRVCG
jgi:enterochelin esterase-like enzyme